MAFIGNTPTTQSFSPATDYFSGNGSTTAFTLSRPVASVNQVEAVIENVVQNPSDAYTVSGNTITFTSAPPSGTNNIYVRYTSPITQVMKPGQNTVGTQEITAGAVTSTKLASASVDLASSTVTGSLPVANGGTGTSAGVTGFKNRIINGAMVIDQRNSGASVTITTNHFTVDRWAATGSQSSKFTVQQNAGSVTPPIGFTNYLGCTSSSAYSVVSDDYFLLTQPIEGFNIADLGWGTANAKTVTLSFWVRSSLTGTFGGALNNSAVNRSYPFSYTISAANTWEQKTVTIAGDTSGTWLTTNGIGIRVYFGLGVGSTYSGTAGSWSGNTYFSATGATSVVGTNGATFYITGVQLEVGSTATSFDYRPYGTELALCQRYYYGLSGSGVPIMIGQAYSTSAAVGAFVLPTEMRAIPTLSYNILNAWTSTGGASNATTWTIDSGSSKLLRISASGGSGLVAGNASGMYLTGASSYFNLSAEL